MKRKAIEKSIYISAPKEHVWEVLLNDQYMRIWCAPFSEGSHAETDWKVGSKAKFTDSTNNGIIGTVIENKPFKAMAVEFEGVVMDGKEDYESEQALQVKGGRESYHLSEREGRTLLEIESEMPEEYFESMSQAWDLALQKIEQLSLSLSEKVS